MLIHLSQTDRPVAYVGHNTSRHLRLLMARSFNIKCRSVIPSSSRKLILYAYTHMYVYTQSTTAIYLGTAQVLCLPLYTCIYICFIYLHGISCRKYNADSSLLQLANVSRQLGNCSCKGLLHQRPFQIC